MRNIFWSLTSTFLSKGFATVFTIVLGNLLLPADLGIYVAIMMVLTYAGTLLSVHIDSAIVQKLNDLKLSALRTHYFSAGWLVITFIAVSVISIMYLFRGYMLNLFNLEGQQMLFMLALPLIFLNMNDAYFNRVLQADLKLKLQTLINIFGTIVQIVSSLILIAAGYNLFGLIAGVYLGRIAAFAGLGYVSFKTHGFRFDKEVVGVAKDLLKFGGLIHIGAIAVFLDKNIDVFFVNYFLSKEELAIYNYALKIALLLILFGNSISKVTYPKLTEAFSSAISMSIDRIYSMSLNFSFLILSVFSLVLVFHLEYVINLILPPVYLDMMLPFTVLIFGIVFYGAFAAVGTIFTARGIPGYGAFSVWLALGVNILLNLILIPSYGMIGGAIATSTSFTARVIIGMILVERRIKTNYKYSGIILSYTMLIGFVLLGRFVVDSQAMRELFIAIFIAASFPLLLGYEEKQFLKKLLGGWKTSKFFLKNSSVPEELGSGKII